MKRAEFYCVVLTKGRQIQIGIPAADKIEADEFCKIQNEIARQDGWKATMFPLPGINRYLLKKAKAALRRKPLAVA